MKAMRFGAEYDVSRAEKATKIIRLLQADLKQDLHLFSCLDLGCAKGIISRHLLSSFKSVFGIDVDEALVKEAVVGCSEDSTFAVADAGKAPFPEAAFDVIVCAQVYEHTPDQPALADEIWRLLKPGGVCFFSGPNRWSPIEEHYWLPFLSWLPRPLANLYMRLAKRGPAYDVRPLYYWQLKALFRRFEIHDYTVQLFRHPEKYGLTSRGILLRWVKLFPTWLMKLFTLWLPNYNWILVKRD